MIYFLRILNYVAFQVCWFVLLIYGNIGISLVVGYLIIHFLLIYYIDNRDFIKLELITICLVSLIGILFDTFMLFDNIYLFPNSKYIPVWYLVLWPLYASTLNHSFYLFAKLPWFILAVIGAISLPIMYLGAAQVTSNFIINEPVTRSLLYIGIEWFVLFPLTMKIAVVLKQYLLDNRKNFVY